MYDVIQAVGKKQYLYSKHDTQHDAIEALIKLQFTGKRGLRVVKNIPYAQGMHEQVTVFK